ncbi:unnamed protein product [Symbiodinium necroappetens]|uniref:Peptidase C1A papain C-terminal domain-containing protein n=1 Tax=Symbiodinium necroappetens TaxID=1628268 RepID=A0A812WJI0_9DINO|nr:unnamed protein product [Symbiodinium necroappetens]
MGTCESTPATGTEIKVEKHPAMTGMQTRTVQRFGWKPDMPDHRDLHVKFGDVQAPSQIKKKAEGQKELVDLRPQNGGFPIFDQGHLGSCTANALAAAFHFTLHKMEVENGKDFADFTPSRLFIYYNERLVEGSVNQDAGAMIRDGIKVMAKVGVCALRVFGSTTMAPTSSSSSLTPSPTRSHRNARSLAMLVWHKISASSRRA